MPGRLTDATGANRHGHRPRKFFARSSAALAYLSGARWRAGFHAFAGEASYRGNLMTHRLSFNSHLHTTLSFDSLVAALDCLPESLPTFDFQPRVEEDALPRFAASAEEDQAARRVIRELIGTRVGAPLILLNANASDLCRCGDGPLRATSSWRGLLARYPGGRGGIHRGARRGRERRALVARVGPGERSRWPDERPFGSSWLSTGRPTCWSRTTAGPPTLVRSRRSTSSRCLVRRLRICSERSRRAATRCGRASPAVRACTPSTIGSHPARTTSACRALPWSRCTSWYAHLYEARRERRTTAATSRPYRG